MGYGIAPQVLDEARNHEGGSFEKLDNIIFPPSGKDTSKVLKIILLGDPENMVSTPQQLESGFVPFLMWQKWGAYIPNLPSYTFTNIKGKDITCQYVPKLNVIYHQDAKGELVRVGKRFLTKPDEDPGTYLRDNSECWPVAWRQALTAVDSTAKYPQAAWKLSDAMAVRCYVLDENTNEIIQEEIEGVKVNKEFILELSAGYLSKFREVLSNKATMEDVNDARKQAGQEPITNFNGFKMSFKRKVAAGGKTDAVVTLLTSGVPMEVTEKLYVTKMYPTGEGEEGEEVDNSLTFLKNITWESQREYLMNAFGIVIPQGKTEDE